MPSRGCANCGKAKPYHAFSSRQWRKGVGRSRCADCVSGAYEGEGALPTERFNNESGAVFTRHDLEHPFEEGGFRWVAKGRYVTGPRAGEPCVAKWFKTGYAINAADYRADIKCARKAVQIVREFNADRIIDIHVRVNIPEVWEFGADTGFAGVKYMQEPYIENYDKWNSNNGWYRDNSDWALAMQALSHFSYHKTGGNFLLCDIQGGFGAHGAVLTDPAILSRTMTYGDTDMGPEGISNFFAIHRCSNYCDPRWMKPAEPQNYYDPMKATTFRQRTQQTKLQEGEDEAEPGYYQDENGEYYYYKEPDDDDTQADTEDTQTTDEDYLEDVEYEYEVDAV